MTLRYAEGSGRPPLHLAAIKHFGGGNGALVFVDRGGEEKIIPFHSDAERIEMLRSLMNRAVPFSRTGKDLDPTDELEFLLAGNKLQGSYVELAWRSTERWVVREIDRNNGPWERVDHPSMLANILFDPQALLRRR